MKPFWTDPGDASERRFLAEHGTVGRMAGDELVIDAGNGALLPPWPPAVNLPGLMVPLGAEAELERSTCRRCGTAVSRREGEWRHEVSWRDRGGCMTAEGP